ncbi:MAG: M48 family metallopeptidase [Bdellovibrionaceae bacterium]|nr:M48 family metallopeptidase [Pseudobdellovibrionaceae bacterium]
MKLHPYLFAVALAFTTVVACSTSPTGRRQLMAVNDKEMDQMGFQAFEEIKKKQKISHDPAQNQYVKCITNAIVAVAPDSQGWEVVVFQDDSANAFALPGKKIGVHTGLLKVARTQDQVAAVLGHEVGHVMARHSAERVSADAVSGLGMSIAGAIGSIFVDPNSNAFKLGMGALGVGVQFGAVMPYGRAHESEADVIGLDLMAQAGFNPQDSVQLWKNMAEGSKGSPPEFLSTHPSNETRIQGLQAKMAPALQKYQAAQAAGRRPACRL